VAKKAKKVSQKIHEAAAELGSLGGKKGGPARAKKLTPEQRSEIARLGGLAKAAKSGVKGNKEISAKHKKKEEGK